MESEFSNLSIASDEKQQTGWFDLPYEMRIMIIEMMDAITRGKLSSCSKLCCKEVRGSKNYINSIELSGLYSNITLTVRYQNYSFSTFFSKCTEKNKEKCLISYRNRFGVKTSKKVDGSMNDIIPKQFYRIVDDAIHLKEIAIKSNWFPYDKTNITHLSKLEVIDIKKNGPINLLECGFLSMNQLVSATIWVHIEGTTVEIDELIKFKAGYIELTNVTFSPEQLNQYLRAWKNCEIDENVNSVTIEFSDGVNLCNVADDIVTGLDVVPSDTGRRVHFHDIKNIAGKEVSIRITSKKIEVYYKMAYESDYYNYLGHDYDSDY